MHRLTNKSPHNKHVLAYGLRVGFWPCLAAYFIQFTIGKHMLDFWYGLPSYKNEHV